MQNNKERKQSKDERIVDLENKIYAEGYKITVGIASVIMLLVIIFKRDGSSYIPFAIIIVLPALYVFVKNIFLGNKQIEPKQSFIKRAIQSLLAGCLTAIVIALTLLRVDSIKINTIAQQAILGFLISIFGSFIVITIIQIVSSKIGKRREDKITDDIEKNS